MLDETIFRQSLPEFASTTDYPSFHIQMYLRLGKKMLPESRWQDCLDDGLTLYVAHYLVLYSRERTASETVGPDAVGNVVGVETSKSVDSVSVSMDVGAVTFADAGHWNQTSYGVQFYQLALIFGAGGIQL